MNLATIARNGIAAATAVVLLALPAGAQELSDTHLQAARAAISAMSVTDQFDAILPQAAQALKADLISSNPNHVELINTTVDEQAFALASRRGDLEREAAAIYARSFTEEDLKSIAAFYTSEAGKKLLANGNIAFRQLNEAAAIWQRGLIRDLSRVVDEKLIPVIAPEREGADGQPEAEAQPAPAQ